MIQTSNADPNDPSAAQGGLAAETDPGQPERSARLRRAIATWLRTFAETGLVIDPSAQEGLGLATRIVGRDRFGRLRDWMAALPAEALEREKVGAIRICIWMAQADRRIDPSERALVEELISGAGIRPEVGQALGEELFAGVSLEGIHRELTHPVLRELMIVLAWQLALADGDLDAAEMRTFGELAEALELTRERAEALREAAREG
ncbi:MAG: TerB family tellurite resistance protein [Myxococcales bacterium]|nr:TerB family tellurite resistance protein [Myxococcales bacterium]